MEITTAVFLASDTSRPVAFCNAIESNSPPSRGGTGIKLNAAKLMEKVAANRRYQDQLHSTLEQRCALAAEQVSEGKESEGDGAVGRGPSREYEPARTSRCDGASKVCYVWKRTLANGKAQSEYRVPLRAKNPHNSRPSPIVDCDQLFGSKPSLSEHEQAHDKSSEKPTRR